MAALADGIYQIAFTDEQLLTAPEPRPGVPLFLLPRGEGLQEWQVSSNGKGNGNRVITIPEAPAHVSYDGEPDMHELALVLPEPREWNVVPAAKPDTYFINVTDAPMRLGLSLLRIFPPRVALAPEYGDPYQAWTFRKIR
ncbi:hypothetical protein ACFWDQ_23750 [Streptomyces sp. NPDC060053]|uniref:hypothetical protein n=1 Tax=Streptomyces sp. NPDC060053 TaxID=3347047 RepID=UPI0036ACA7AD